MMTRSVIERAMGLISPEPNCGCWLWMGAVNRGGYGFMHAGYVDGKRIVRTAHRAIYQALKGPVPDEIDLDHLCRIRSCVNPDHLEPVTRSENLRRGVGAAIVRARTSQIELCPQGHPLSGPNLYMGSEGKRACRECRSAAGRRYAAKKRHGVV
jgi:hypothetical protein